MFDTIRLRALLGLGIVALCLAAMLADSSPTEAEPNSVEIAYTGELLDEKRKPIAGVYPLEFKLYNDRRSERALWSETHWVAIVDGAYNVRLGSESRIRKTLAKPGARLYLGIHLMGGGELLREPISFPKEKKKEEEDEEEDKKEDEAQKDDKKDDKKIAEDEGDDDEGKDDDAPTRYRTESSFAELAEYAKKAGKAEDAERLNGKTLAELEAEIEKLRDELSRHRTDKDVHGGGGEVTIGTTTRVLPRVGGRGGAAFTRECPPGHVVTGIRGAAGALIDSIQLICSPLE